MRVTLSIDAPTDNILTIEYMGNPQHDGKELQSRRIRGEQWFHLAQKFIDNPSLRPSMEYSKQIGEMDPTKFASSNRTGVGISSNAFRLISSRAKKDQRTLEGLEEKIRNIGKEIRMHDKERANECERSTQQKFFGYIQSATVSDDCLRIVLVEEDTTRLYHPVAASAIFYVDATGGLFEDIRDAGQVLYYAMVLGHPFGSAPLLPVAELVTNSHTSDSIKRLFQELRYREREVFKSSENAMPIGIMTDFSLAIINAAISEYNNETFKQYIERTYKIMVGEAPRQDLEKLFVFTCTAHIMKNVKRNAGKSKDVPWQSSKQHSAMRFFGRLIHSSSLAEATNLVFTAYIVFHSEYVTDSVDTALKELEEAINTFSPDIKSCIEEVQEESINDTRNTESPLTYDSNVPSAQAEMLRAKDTEIVRYWKAMLQPLEKHKKSMDTKLPKNKYHNPEFMDYCFPYLLPSIALWSRILDGEFAKFSNDYRDFSIDRASSTTGHVEQHFGLLKQNKVKPSLDKFIMCMWESKRGTKRIFADGLVRGKKREPRKQQKTFLRGVKLLEEEERISPSRPQSDKEDVPLPEESWLKPSTPRSMPQKSRVGRYQQPPFKPIHVSPKVKVETDELERPKLDSHKTYEKASASEPKGASSKQKRVTNTYTKT